MDDVQEAQDSSSDQQSMDDVIYNQNESQSSSQLEEVKDSGVGGQ